MARTPHVPEILTGPLSARPPASVTPSWVWYAAQDDDGGAIHRPTPGGWVRATGTVDAGPWQSPSLQNSWSAATPAFQFRLNHGTVELRGGVTRASGSLPSVVTTLPVGHRPAGQAWLPVVVANGLAILGIASNGEVTAYAATAGGGASTNSLLALDGVRFAV